MWHNVTLGAVILLALASAALIPEDATARTHRYVDGRPSVCGRGNIPVRLYAANHYFARPVVCGGGPVNANLQPDFQLTRTR
jgi:hypothetical protein